MGSLLVGGQAENRREHGVDVDQHLEHRDILADAMPRADRKRKYRRSDAVSSASAPANRSGLNSSGFAPEGRMPMQHVWADEHIGPRGDGVTPEFRPPRACARVMSHPGG